MPWSISEHQGRGLPPVSPNMGGGGGYQVAHRPDPNSGMELFKRGQGAPQAQGGFNPAITASGESALSANLGLQQRGMQNRQQFDQAESARNPYHNIGAPVDPMWEGLKQALYERGTGEIQTGGVGGMDMSRGQTTMGPTSQGGGITHMGQNSGFFDTQSPSMNGLIRAAGTNPGLDQQRGEQAAAQAVDSYGMANYNRKMDQRRRGI